MDDFSVSGFEKNASPSSMTESCEGHHSAYEQSQPGSKNAETLLPSGSHEQDKYGVTPESFMEMDLNALLIQDKLASYLYRASEDNIEFVQKDSMLLVDRSLKHQVGDIVVIGVDGEILLRRFVMLFHPQRRKPLPALITDREDEPPIFPNYSEVFFKGVVRCIIQLCRPCQ